MAEKQKKINAKKLYKELKRAGVPVAGVQGNGIITYGASVNPVNPTTVKEIMDAHNSVENAYAEQLKEVYYNLRNSDKKTFETVSKDLMSIIKKLEPEIEDDEDE